MRHVAPATVLLLSALVAPALHAQLVPGPSGRSPTLGGGQVGLRGPAQPGLLLVSVDSQGLQADGPSDAVVLSADGRVAAFSSVAANLGPGGPAGLRDVFVRDLVSGATVLASRALDGHPGGGASGSVLSISADGRTVAFESFAPDLVPGDTNGTVDVFLYDRALDLVTRVSVGPDGMQAGGPSSAPSLSADGRLVAFTSWADDLVPGDDELQQDVFVHDRQTGVTERISESADGTGGSGPSSSPALSASGRFVAFSSRANELVDEPLSFYHYIFVRDRDTGETWHASKNDFGAHATGESDTRPAITPDGRYVAFASHAYNLAFPDLNWESDVFVHDHVTGLTRRVSVGPGGLEGNGGSLEPALSPDGRFVVFTSGASNLVADDDNGAADVFLHDTSTGLTCRLSRSLDGSSPKGASSAPALSPEGGWLAFTSAAADLVSGDGNGVQDAFLGALDAAQD